MKKIFLHDFGWAIVSCVALALSAGCTTATAADVRNTALPKSPDYARSIDAFSAQAKIAVPVAEGGKTVQISERISAGLEAAARRLTLPDGTTVDYGFKHQDATVASVVISDAQRQVRMVALASSLPLLRSSRGEIRVATPEDYQKMWASAAEQPWAVVMVRNPKDLPAYLPYVQSWIEAMMLGMNADCALADMNAVCALARQHRVPVTAYLLKSGVGLERLATPVVEASSVPASAFQ